MKKKNKFGLFNTALGGGPFKYTCCTVQTRERVRVPHSMTGTLSSVHISGTISTLIGSFTAHCGGADVDYDFFCRQ